MGLDKHPSAGGYRLGRQRIEPAPIIRRFTIAEHPEGDRYSSFQRERFQAAQIVVDAVRIEARVFAGDFKNSGAKLAHHPDELPHFDRD